MMDRRRATCGLSFLVVWVLSVAVGLSFAAVSGRASLPRTAVPYAYDASVQLSSAIPSSVDPTTAAVRAIGPVGRSAADSSRGPAVFVAADTADVVVPNAWNAATKLPSGGTVRDVGSQIWGNGLPSATRLSGMTDEELRGLASLDDAKTLNAMYRGAQASVPNNATAPIRVQLSQQVIDAWGRK